MSVPSDSTYAGEIKVKKSTTKDKDVFEFWDGIAKANCRLELENKKTQSTSTVLNLGSSKDAGTVQNKKELLGKGAFVSTSMVTFYTESFVLLQV